MATNFVPLQPSGAAAGKPPSAPPTLKPVVPAKELPAPGGSAPTPAAPAPPTGFSLFTGPAGSTCTGGNGQPLITLKKDGERVVQIRVQCTCGQVIELACDY